jgi:hypothetical protein
LLVNQLGNTAAELQKDGLVWENDLKKRGEKKPGRKFVDAQFGSTSPGIGFHLPHEIPRTIPIPNSHMQLLAGNVTEEAAILDVQLNAANGGRA